MNELFFQTLIDIETWNTAGWKGTAYFHDPSGKGLPMLGIIFQNLDAGKRIFSDWHKRLGKVDKFEELRVSIIEGDIPGEDPGYTVYISSDPDNTLKRAKAEGVHIGADLIAVVGRVHRMNPAPGSPHLPRFKQEFQRHGRYFLVPVSVQGEPATDLAIGKAAIHFRRAEDITADDVDSAVFPEDHFKR